LFVANLPKKSTTIVILDNASTHTSKLFQTKIEEWKQKGLILYFLPPYAPELNRIEILWRFMKYHWIKISDYASTQTLKDYIHRVLAFYGKNKEFEINFG
jgi:transposase